MSRRITREKAKGACRDRVWERFTVIDRLRIRGASTPPTITAFAAFGMTMLFGAASQGQVVLDPTFSGDTVTAGEYAPGQNTDYLIRESYGQRSGDNLFHRFTQFDVPTGQSATFIEDAPGSGIRRIVAQVGGNSASQIDGVLRSTIPNADLYFLNARGVVFGPNAQLDLLGAFHASSADYIRFNDNVRFGTDLGGPAISITSAEPAAWGFLSSGAGEIAVEGARLSMGDGQDLSFVGGPIRIEGPGTDSTPNVETYSASLSLISIDSAGEVAISPGSAPNVDLFAALGPVTLSNGAVVSANGADDQVLIVRSDSLTLEDATINAHHFGTTDHPGVAVDVAVRYMIRLGRESLGQTADFLSFTSRTGGGAEVGNAGSVLLSADTLLLEGSGTTLAVGSTCNLGFFCSSATRPAGEGGALNIDVDRLLVRDGAEIFSVNAGLGQGSPISIRARSVEVGAAPGSPEFTSILTIALGDDPFAPGSRPSSGDLTIDASEQIVLENFGSIETRTLNAARGGSIAITTGDLQMIDTDPVDTERSAIITTTAGRGLIDPSGGDGQAGNVTIDATGDVSLEGGAIRSQALFGDTPNPANGLPGEILVRAPNGTFRLGPRATVTSTVNDGLGARTTVEANSILIEDGGLIQSTFSRDGQAGDIHLTADTITIQGSGGGLRSKAVNNASANGDAGLIEIDGRSLLLADGASIRVDGVDDGAAGAVVIGANAPLASVVINDASIEAVTSGAAATGGSIEINADRIRLDNNARITASNVFVGGTGSIDLNGDVLELMGGSEITATSGVSGLGGNISLRMTDRIVGNGGRVATDSQGIIAGNEGGNIDLTAQVIILSDTLLDASSSGAGGRIQITAGRFLPAANNPPPTATGGTNAQNGVVEILASETNTASAVPRPAVVYEDPGQRLATGCDARTDAQGSLYVLPAPLVAPPGEGRGDLVHTENAPDLIARASGCEGLL